VGFERAVVVEEQPAVTEPLLGVEAKARRTANGVVGDLDAPPGGLRVGRRGPPSRCGRERCGERELGCAAGAVVARGLELRDERRIDEAARELGRREAG
jgi:hypothetical protein